MTEDGVAELVARMFAAAGREFGKTHLEVYADALENVSDDVGREAARNLARHVSWEKPPSVGMVLDEVNAILRLRQLETPAIEEATGQPVTREQALAWVAHIKKKHGASAMTDALEAVARRQGSDDGAGEASTGGQRRDVPGVVAADTAGEDSGATPRDRGGEQ